MFSPRLAVVEGAVVVEAIEALIFEVLPEVRAAPHVLLLVPLLKVPVVEVK